MAVRPSGRGPEFDARVRADKKRPNYRLFQSAGAREVYDAGERRPWLTCDEYEVFKLFLRWQSVVANGGRPLSEREKQFFRVHVASGEYGLGDVANMEAQLRLRGKR